LAQYVIPMYKCPSNGITQTDFGNYGITDYMPIAYTDIDSVTGLRNASGSGGLNADVGGPLGFCRKISDITDGMSNVMLVIEDAARPTQTGGHYSQSTIFVGNGTAATSAFTATIDSTQLYATETTPGVPKGYQGAPNRWADPDNGSGISGPSTQDPQNKNGTWYIPGSITQVINNWKTPSPLGPAVCPWAINNCGPNDEPFSTHNGGCMAVFGDGRVRFMNESTYLQIIRMLATRNDGVPVGDF
jgi:prepilin-type processing-associated H-X9-DG protein